MLLNKVTGHLRLIAEQGIVYFVRFVIEDNIKGFFVYQI